MTIFLPISYEHTTAYSCSGKLDLFFFFYEVGQIQNGCFDQVIEDNFTELQKDPCSYQYIKY